MFQMPTQDEFNALVAKAQAKPKDPINILGFAKWQLQYQNPAPENQKAIGILTSAIKYLQEQER